MKEAACSCGRTCRDNILTREREIKEERTVARLDTNDDREGGRELTGLRETV